MGRRAAELLASLVLLLIGAGFLVGAAGLGIGRLSEPGPGMLPAFAGGLLALLSAVHTAACWARRDPAEPAIRIGRTPALRIASSVGAIIATAIAAPHIGFLAASAAMLFVLFHVVAALKLAPSLIVTAAVSGANYVVFVVLLKVPLP